MVASGAVSPVATPLPVVPDTDVLLPAAPASAVPVVAAAFSDVAVVLSESSVVLPVSVVVLPASVVVLPDSVVVPAVFTVTVTFVIGDA